MYRKKLAKRLGTVVLILGIAAAQPVFFVSAKTETAPTEADDAQTSLPDNESDAKTPGEDGQEQTEALKISPKTYKHNFKTKQGVVYAKLSYQYPAADGDSLAADTFNNFYRKQKKNWIANAKKELRYAKQDAGDIEKNKRPCNSDEVTCSFVQTEQYISVVQPGYYHISGAAHGMPYRISYLFQADTGKKISAAKILGITKKALNNRVSKMFMEQYNKQKGSEESLFYDTHFIPAKEIKKSLKKMDFNDRCYLENNKLHFYADPYSLGPYSSGFIEVTIKI